MLFLDSGFLFWVASEFRLCVFVLLVYSYYGNKFKEEVIYYFIVSSVAGIALLYRFFIVEETIYLTIFLKLGIFPFHTWVVPVTQFIPTRIFFIILTLNKLPFLAVASLYTPIIYVVCLSLLIGIISAISNHNYKSILARLSIRGRSVFLIASTVKVILLYFSSYTLSLFILLISKIDKRSKFYSVIMVLSLIGFPPFFIFAPKILLLISLFSHSIGLFLLVSFYYTLSLLPYIKLLPPIPLTPSINHIYFFGATTVFTLFILTTY